MKFQVGIIQKEEDSVNNSRKIMDNKTYVNFSVVSSDKYIPEGNRIVLAIDKSMSFDKYNIAFEFTSKPKDDQWVLVFPEEIAGYMAFILNDPIYIKQVFGSQIERNKKYRVSKSKLASLKIPLVDISISVYYSLIEAIFQNLYLENNRDDNQELMLNIFYAIRLALSFELHQHQISKEFKIDIFSNWKQIVDSIGTDMTVLFDDIMKPDNGLLNNVRRFQLLLGSLQKIMKSNGLETE